MNKATSIDSRYLTFAGMVTANITAVPIEVVEFYLQNENREQFPSALRRGFVISGVKETKPDNNLAGWAEFYEKEFGIILDTTSLKIPVTRKDFDCLVVVAAGLSMNQVYDACAKRFRCYRYTDDLDASVTVNDRKSKEAYAIWVRDRIEADEEHKEKSADDLKSASIPGITLLERMILELKYWKDTGKHLDIKNWTLCSGSRDSGGDVPGVCWGYDRFSVRWCYASGRYGDLRVREVVTL